MNNPLSKLLKPKHYQAAYDPDILPPESLMRREGITVLEEWFRWAEEWSMLLRIYGHITRNSSVLEIGCGLGRIAFPLRYILSEKGSYEGFEICRYKVDFLENTFHTAFPNFSFTWADIHNTYYNPHGKIKPEEFRFPYRDSSFDIVFAASVFTHMLPGTVKHYFNETARVLKPSGRAVFSFFFLDNYLKGRRRPLGFASPEFNFDHHYGSYGNDFATVVPDNPEQMTAYNICMLGQFAAEANMKPAVPPLPGLWSGAKETWVGAQDLLILNKL